MKPKSQEQEYQRSMKEKIASFISVAGHPLLTIPVFVVIALFSHEEASKAFMHSSLIVIGVFLPVIIKMYLNSKNGRYTNFDVSDRAQRQSWYYLPIILLLILTIILFVTDQPRALCLSVLFALVLLTASQLINYYIKSSLHVAFHIFLSFLIIPLDTTTGLILLVFTIFIAWARLTLKRHTLKEIISGTVLGLIVGIISLYYI